MFKFKELIIKYNVSTLNLKEYSPSGSILPNIESFIIKNFGDGMGNVVIDENSVELIGSSFSNYSFEQLLELRVDTNSWNEYSWDSKHIFTECDVVNILVDELRVANELFSS